MAPQLAQKSYGVSQGENTSLIKKWFGGNGGNGKTEPLLNSAAGLYGSLNSVQANILIADTDFKLVFLNNKAIETFRGLEGLIKKTFGVALDDMVGQPIHRFHKDPRRVEQILTNPSALPNTAEFVFGEATLSTTVNSITDTNGAVRGYIVSLENITEAKKNAEGLVRVNSMMENSPSNIIFADAREFKIQYVNPASVKTLKTIEQYLPVRVDEIQGSSIDIFHKDPEHQRKLLSDPKNLPHRAIIDVGPEKLDLLVSAIFDDNNNYIGPMVTWSVVTEKLKLENEMARVMSMMENSPSNIIFADAKEFKVQYVNPESVKTLKTIEQYLPVRVDEILGSSIDIFHKNPEHQRKLLSDPKNLPHQAIIEVGPEKLDLLVSAIYDHNDSYIGPMVTWSVVTEKLKLEGDMARVMSMMENAPANIIFADAKEFKVQYVNPASVKTLKTIEQYLPVRVDEIQGSSIDLFHKNPEHQRKLLSDPKNLPHQAIIEVGPEKLDLLVSAIYDNHDNYIGPMVTWSVVTEKLRMEAEMARVQSMMENSPSNIIFADAKEFKVQYVNPASVKTLKTIEQYLPVRVDEIQGSSIDLFHKNPEHQRKLLSDPKNLPHQAIIEVGPEKLDLLVSATFDNNNSYIGPMVTWSVVTEKLKMEADMARVQSMMENSPSNIIFADAKEFKVQYVNPESVKTLKTIEQYLPVRVDEILGSSIDIFHKNPDHQRRILSDPKNLPHKAIIEVGPEKLDLLVSATFDNNNNYIGPMVTWSVVTEKLRMEEEVGRIQSMVENAPINIVFADAKEFKIQYANPASITTLQTIEQYLPVRVEEVLGSSLDIFHKNPEHQRRLVSDPKNLPHTAIIDVGPEKLDLLVSAIYDNNNNYIGPMVTWEVITERLAAEKREKEGAERMQTVIERVGQNAQTLAGAAEELTSVSQQMAGNAEETSAQAGVVSSASTEVKQSVETVATGTEEMTASIKEIAQNSTEAAKVTASAVKMAESTNTIITKLGDSSAEIGEVIKVITSIAEQTNLLALNATIEAARAGEAGKGFAVVANEVKELANQTAKATEDISKKIQTIQEDARGSVDEIGKITEIINRIDDIANTIASSVEEQSATTNEMSRNVLEAAKGTEEIANNVNGVAEAAKSTSQGANDTQRAAEELSRLAAELQEVVRQDKKE